MSHVQNEVSFTKTVDLGLRDAGLGGWWVPYYDLAAREPHRGRVVLAPKGARLQEVHKVRTGWEDNYIWSACDNNRILKCVLEFNPIFLLLLEYKINKNWVVLWEEKTWMVDEGSLYFGDWKDIVTP